MYANVLRLPRLNRSQYRLEPGLEDRIARIAKLAKRSEGAVLEELADEAERMRRYPA